MGACCGGNHIGDPDIESCEDIRSVIETLIAKKNKFPEEQKEIETYLNDSSKEPSSINVAGIAKEDLEKRIAHLSDLDQAYSDIINMLYENQTVSYYIHMHIHLYIITYS